MDQVLVRSAAVRILFVVIAALAALAVLAALAGSAHAMPEPPPDVRVAGALFTPTRTTDGIDWTAQWVLTPDGAADLDGGATRIVRFAIPLADDDSIEPMAGVVPLVERGRVTGIVVDRRAVEHRTVRVVVHQRAVHEGSVRIGAPVAAGSALQIVDGDLGAGMRLEIETGRLLERGVGHVAPPGTSHAARDEARRLTGYEPRVTGAPLFVRGDDVVLAGGLRGTVVTAKARGHRSTVALAALFVGSVGALVFAMRKLRHAASVERADTLLAAEVDALDGVTPRS